MGTHPIFESDFDCLTATHPDSHEAPKMPGVQDNYSIDVTNRFGFAGIDVDSGNDDAIENVDPFAVLNDLKQQAEIAKSLPKKKVQKKAAPVKAAEPEKKESGEGEKKVERRRGEGGRRGGRGDGRPRGDRPPRERREPRSGEVEGAPREERRGRGDRENRRTGDRKSGDPRTTYKGNDKRDGAGAGNWGTPEDELKAQTEPVADEVAKEEAEKKDDAPPAAPEPEEPKTMTLEEYRKQKKSVLSNPNAKTQNQTAATTQKERKEREKKGRAARVQEVNFTAAPLVQRGGNRGGRNAGRGDRRDRQPRNDKQEPSLDLNDADGFPTLK